MPQALSQEFYAIVVDVPNPDLKCFVAFPFSLKAPTEEHPLTEVIDKALRRRLLDPDWIDWERPGIPIVETLTSKIRGARMVIAVCSPDEATGKVNPNVMYELGLADALGKPTLMMTTDPSRLPFDVTWKSAFKYSNDDLKDRRGRDALQAELERAIDDLGKHTVEPPLVLADLDGVWLERATSRVVSTRCFWNYAKSVYKLADAIRSEGIALAGDLNKASEIAAELISSPSLYGKFMEYWKGYQTAHTARMVQYLTDDARAEVGEHLKLLRNNCSGAANLIEQLAEDYADLLKKVEAYSAAFAKASTLVNFVKRDPKQALMLFGEVSPLEEGLLNLLRSADWLVKQLTQTIHECFTPAP